jgi:hypothetical protein
MTSAAMSPDGEEAAPSSATSRHNLRQLIQLRWIAVLGQVITIFVTQVSFGILLPYKTMLLVVLGLAVFNLFSVLRLRIRTPVTQVELFLALLLDVATAWPSPIAPCLCRWTHCRACLRRLCLAC